MKRRMMMMFALAAAIAVGSAPRAVFSQMAEHDAHMNSHDHMKKSESTSMGSTINVDNFSFSPATVTVSAGTTVTWTNHDDIPHNIVEKDQKFKSKALDTDDSFTHTFTEAGTYEYFCGLHPKMIGKVIVEAKK
jgi:plastocyanin